jgi:asparagine synthetase B (glutamine-hydrolysing)
VLDPWRYSSAEELRLAGDPSLAWRRYLHQIQVVNARRLRDCGFPARGRAEDIIESLWNRCPVNDPVCRRQFIDQQTYLPDQILALTDRMSMANSLEVRVPFMDYRLVRLAQHLGSAAKQNANDYKIFLKRVLGDRCPPQLLSRPKWGFDTPLSRWAGRPEVCAAILRAVELLGRQRLLEIRRLRQMLSGAPAVSRFARWSWNLLVLAVWLKVRDRCSPPGETLAEVLS